MYTFLALNVVTITEGLQQHVLQPKAVYGVHTNHYCTVMQFNYIKKDQIKLQLNSYIQHIRTIQLQKGLYFIV